MPKNRRKIILVDDLNLHLLSTKERLRDYEIFPAQSAEIMFEILERVEPELILMDINMPESNGFETLDRLKSDARYTHIPVVFLTAQHDKECVKKGIRLGAADFITKPFTDSKLIDCIEYQFSPELQVADKPVVLAIDDDPSILKSINYLLNDKYQVRTLPDPDIMKELLKIIKPDLFILDCNMPTISGFELVPIIRNMPNHEDTPIIFLTSDGIADNVYAATSIGASDFLVKPINEDLFREKVAKHLHGYVMRRRMRTL